MDVDIGDHAANEAQEARQELPFAQPEHMVDAVEHQGMQPGIGKENLDAIARRRIAGQYAVDVFSDERPAAWRGCPYLIHVLTPSMRIPVD
jgi:hypothetical protein